MRQYRTENKYVFHTVFVVFMYIYTYILDSFEIVLDANMSEYNKRRAILYMKAACKL